MKVDYVLFAKDRSKVFFVELKTDAGSRRDLQDEYLERAEGLGFRRIVEGICSIVRKTTAHQKYHHLVSALADLGYVTMPGDIREFLYPSPKVGLSERLRKVEATEGESTIEVVFVQPKKSEPRVGPPRRSDGYRCIDFAEFAEFVDRHDDALSRVFAAHLRKWRDAAGACVPG